MRAPAATRSLTPIAIRLRRLLSLALVHAVLVAGAVFMLLPFVFMLTSAIKPPGEIFEATFRLWPRRFYGLQNFESALTTAPLLRFLLNGVIVCGGILVVQLLVAIPCAYALAKLKFPGRPVLFSLVLLGLCVPVQAPSLPLYIAFAELGILNTYLSMMMPFFLSVFAIFLFRQFFKTYPDEIIQAARLDGVGEFEIVWRIVVPSAWPAIAAFSVFSVVAHWNDLYWPLIVVSDTQARDTAARHDVFRGFRDRLELWRAGRRRDHHYGAAGHRVPDCAATLHRRHHDDRNQMSSTAARGETVMLHRRDLLKSAAAVGTAAISTPFQARSARAQAGHAGCALCVPGLREIPRADRPGIHEAAIGHQDPVPRTGGEL